ncbi:ligase-associated DNA damage response endonuclease PdeM [Paracoccus albus]|uniref:ligase-associated DNA damage response endonuclease PdeM n=1 Tax=Paracoccus albus TaxID=3017784 RepID=UPI0022F0699E|nr:ligase-associated DNA damage response endonuclease PdeM [Paracoccus albus]WBU61477.1 ligase-associated DNA damage response endonuclease PdeM [Paracoccus albus]
MTGYAFDFSGQRLIARAGGALYWPDQDMLIVADLHLGKSERMARRGGSLLPPFETRETLARLSAELDVLRPSRLVLLGDIFDDDAAAQGLCQTDRDLLDRLAGRSTTIMIAGNHDPLQGPDAYLEQGIALRHIAGEDPDISGHFHPKMRIAGRSRPCFLVASGHLILPAFGHYTGGLVYDDPALRAIVPRGIAVLTGRKAIAVPYG